MVITTIITGDECFKEGKNDDDIEQPRFIRIY